jgi:glutaredoxin
MKRFPLLVGLVSILIIIGGVFLLSNDPGDNPQADPPTLPEAYEYYWGEGCPHCANVEEFLNTWENKDKVQVDKKEVYKDQDNINLFQSRVKYCELPNNQVGVPFLFTPEGECVVGDTPIINLFEQLEFEEE